MTIPEDQIVFKTVVSSDSTIDHTEVKGAKSYIFRGYSPDVFLCLTNVIPQLDFEGKDKIVQDASYALLLVKV